MHASTLINPRIRGFVLSTAVILATFIPASAHAADRRKLDRGVRDVLQSGTTAPQSVIIRVQSGQVAAAKALLASLGDAVETEHPNISALSARVNVNDLDALTNQGLVLSVSINARVTGFANPNNTQTTAVSVLRATQGLTATSPTGKGIGVAIIDSGIQPNSDFNGHIVAFYDFVKAGGALAPAYDDFGHGTHVAGLIASSGALGAQYQGVAPGVNLIGLKVLNGQGHGSTSDVIKAITFVTANKAMLGVDVINLSLGHPVYESAATDPLVQAVEAAVRAGIVVVTAAGNFGQNSNGQVGYAGITVPGNAPSALTVGAFEDQGTIGRGDDIVAPYSGRGPTDR